MAFGILMVRGLEIMFNVFPTQNYEKISNFDDLVKI